jgi:uncharacterized protein
MPKLKFENVFGKLERGSWILRIAGEMVMHYEFYLLLSTGVFAGAVVSGFAGFAFSAVAGAVLMHLIPPVEAIPLMMTCSIVPQSAGLVALRKAINWRDSLPYMIGGVAGIPPALYFLHHLHPSILRAGFGLFIAAYATYMLICPKFSFNPKEKCRRLSVLIGFVGGVIGGVTAMPGAAPTIWCNMRPMAKENQRGIIQPYIIVMQIVAIALLIGTGEFNPNVLVNAAISLPSLGAGTALGLFLFRNVSHGSYRRVVLSLLLAGGIGLTV